MRAPRSIAAVLIAGLALISACLSSSPAQAAGQYHASVGMTGLSSSHATSMGQTVTISGKVWGGAVKNQKVSIYVDNVMGPGAFTRLLAVVPINASNRYTYQWKTDDAGAFQLRVVKGSYKSTKSVKVTSKKFDVYRWTGRSPGANAAGTTVAGVEQPASAFVLKPGVAADMSITQDGCRAMRLKLGISDTSSGGGRLIFTNREENPAPQAVKFTVDAVKGEAMKQYQYDGTSSFYNAAFTADFGASPGADDGIVLADVQVDCTKPVVNQWNRDGLWFDEYLDYWCPGEQVLRADDPRCKTSPW